MQVTRKSFVLAAKAKPMAAAVAMAAALMAPAAHAVNVSQDGLGEVLLFPYYTVNNGFDTNINITNTSENLVVFKIRFREGHNSRDARDFNVALSPFDVWNATITASPNGGARLTTSDTSCTAGQLPLDLGNGLRGVDFTNYDYITATGVGPNDTGPTTLARNGEGYIEVIEMGHQRPTNPGAASPNLVFAANSVGHNSQHVNNVPRDCNAVRTAFSVGNVAATAATFFEPINVLKGTASLIKATEGKAISYEPTVLANFFNPDPSGVDDAAVIGSNLIVNPESQRPQLDDVTPRVAELFTDTINAPVFADFTLQNGENAVSAVISRQVVVNQFSVNPANAASTDWIVTMPTKYFYVDERENGGSELPLAPFDANDTFQNAPEDCAVVDVQFRYFNREEAEQVNASTVGFSPAPPGTPGDAICYETSVLTFNNTNVFGSPLAANVPVDSAGFNSGWMRLVFSTAGQLASDNGVTFTGLPVIGFAATTLENGTNAAAVLNYGMAWSHGYVTNVQ